MDLIFMKNIFTPPEIQFSGVNRRVKWFRDKMKPFLVHPIKILVVVWVGYGTLDGILTFFSSVPSRGLVFALITAVFGFISSAIYFFWMIPSVFYSSRTRLIIGVSIGAVFLISLLKFFLFSIFRVEISSLGEFLLYELERQIAFLVLTLGMWGFYALSKALLEKGKTEIDLDRLHIEHKIVQLSPHFTLNLIGGLATKAQKSSPGIAQDLENLADVLGYAYVDPTKFNPLSDEIKAIRSYLNGQKVRFVDQLFLNEQISMDLQEMNQLYMPKMILLSLVDNIFKHGDYKNPHHPVSIEAKMVGSNTPDACFYFNTKNRIQTKLPLKPSGFGIPTITNLLEFYFPGFSLQIEKDSLWFSLNLMIPYGEKNTNWPDR